MNKKTTKKPRATKRAALQRNKAFRAVVFISLVQRVEYYIEAPDEQTARQVAYFGEPNIPAGAPRPAFRIVETHRGEPEPQDPTDSTIEECREVELAERTVCISTVDSPQYTWGCPICDHTNDVIPGKHGEGSALACGACGEVFKFDGTIY